VEGFVVKARVAISHCKKFNMPMEDDDILRLAKRFKEFYEHGGSLGRQRLEALGAKLGYNVSEVLYVEQQSYSNHVVSNVGELISKARVHGATNPMDQLVFCFDNLRIVRSYLPENMLHEMSHLGLVIDSVELENEVFRFEDAELRSGA